MLAVGMFLICLGSTAQAETDLQGEAPENQNPLIAKSGLAAGPQVSAQRSIARIFSARAADDNVPGVAIPASPINDNVNDSSDPADVYQIALTAGQALTLNLAGVGGTDFDLYLFPPGTTDIYTASAVAASNGVTYPETITYNVSTSGTYYVLVHAYSGSGNYTLAWSVGAAPPPPEPPPPTGNNKHALLIGVEDYPGTANDLGYTVDDVVDVREALMTNSGFGADDIFTLTDSYATRAQIESAITGWLDSVENPGDTVVIYYSGHGSNVADVAPIDEADGRDETIYVYDGNIRDDELDSWVASLESTRIIVGFDSCYSGGFLKNLVGLSRDSKFVASAGSGIVDKNDGIAKDLNRAGIITMTASNDNELSGEYGSLQNGLYTYYYVEAMKTWSADADSSGLVSAEEIHQYLVPRVVAVDDTQNPQIYDGVTGQLDLANPSGMIGDYTAPATTDDAPAGWQNANFTVNLSCTDSNSGCKETHYTLDGGSDTIGTAVAINTDGDHTIVYHSVDNADNVESDNTVHAKLDKVAPSVSGVLPAGTITDPAPTITASYSDAAPSSGFNAATAILKLNGVTAGTCSTASPTTLSCPTSGLANGHYNVAVSIADNASNSATALGSIDVTGQSVDLHTTYFTWYDNVGGSDWVLLANPYSSMNAIDFDLAVAGEPMSLNPLPGQDAGHLHQGQSLYSIYPGLMDGPVQVDYQSIGNDRALASQRILWGGNSLEEVPSNESGKLSDHFYWTWYDQQSPGYANWVMVSNPGPTPVYYEVTIAGVIPVTAGSTGTIASGGNATPAFPGMMGGPVEVRAWTDSGKATPANVLASQRVLTNYSRAFNEVPGIPASELNSHYLWTWYDSIGAAGSNWIMIANPGDNPGSIYYKIKVGATEEVACGGPIAQNAYAYWSKANLRNGPVDLSTYSDASCTVAAHSIASQRVIWGPSFEEVPGYGDLFDYPYTSTYNWTWYDQQTPGSSNWVMVSNPTDQPVYYEITIAGLDPGAGSKGIIQPGENAVPSFPNSMGGPVQVRAWDDDTKAQVATIMASQRVLWNGHFNEVLGTVLFHDAA